MARPRAWRGQLPRPVLVAFAVGLWVAVAGCATAPSGGPPRPAPGGTGQVQAYVQPLPPPGPTSTWSPSDVVSGFLHASASYAFDPAAARQYLAPSLRKNWHPEREPVAVVGGLSSLTTAAPFSKLEGSKDRTVTVTGQRLATLSPSGHYKYEPGGKVPYHFDLEQTNGVWLIQQIADHTLVLTESDFEHVYQPRNLFFFASAAMASQPSGELLPDPVYAPTESSNSALNTGLATRLVNLLLEGPVDDWLTGLTKSAFPPGTRLLRKVTITGKTAHVDLGGNAAGAMRRFQQVQQMAEQLQATLGDGAYERPLANQVQLSINNRPVNVSPLTDLVPPVPSGPIEFMDTNGGVSELQVPTTHAKSQVRLTVAQIGSAPVTAVASSPNSEGPQQLAVAVQASAACSVELWSGSRMTRNELLPGSRGQCTSLSYDARGNLWAAAGQGIWVLQPGHPPAQVNVSSAVQRGDQILALRMAPDAVRAALLVASGSSKRLLLAAVNLNGVPTLGAPVTVGAGLTDSPLAISWYDAYDVAVLTPSWIYQVPLTSGAGQPPRQVATTPPKGDPRTLTTNGSDNGSDFVVGTTQGVYAEPVSSSVWSLVANGANPAYPG
ncbi:MAG: GerMN domain-containing protein [Actinobacteria bacterium]|nr:GerMN domain-containing protein [Actinomycetota bacterium]